VCIRSSVLTAAARCTIFLYAATSLFTDLSKSERQCHDRQSIAQPVLVSNLIKDPRPVSCYSQACFN
jgi:hypothetical protein